MADKFLKIITGTSDTPRYYQLFESDSNNKKYVGLHIRIRNDESYDQARILKFYYLEIPSDFMFGDEVLWQDFDVDNIVGHGLWMSEWERRGNGDYYHIEEIDGLENMNYMEAIAIFRDKIRGSDENWFTNNEEEFQEIVTKMHSNGHQYFRVWKNGKIESYNDSEEKFHKVTI